MMRVLWPRCRGVTTWLKIALLAACASNLLNFAISKQQPLHLRREREGLRKYSPAGKDFVAAINHPGVTIEPSVEEKKFASILKQSGERGAWSKVRQTLAEYSGYSALVLNAGMQAVLRCRMYHEGAEMFERLREADSPMTLPVYTTAMKLYGKLGRIEEVMGLWEQLVHVKAVDHIFAQACIDAHADNGNITGAGAVLEYMEQQGMMMTERHFSSAINACANSDERYKAKAAKYLMGEMMNRGIKPNLVTYSCALRAMRLSPGQDLLELLADMKAEGLRPNIVIAESFFYIFLKKPPRKGCWKKIEAIAADLLKLPREDLETAKRVMDDFLANGLDLNASCRRIRVVLQSLLRA